MDYQKLLEEIKNRIDIVEFISEYIDLKKTGQNYRALCPFHSEKTPSFFVNPSKQIFHCFGCGKGGDIVNFLMEYEKITFQEALSMLATKAGLKFEPSRNRVSKISKEQLYKIYEESATYYSEQLKYSQKAKKYLKDRGINDETIEQFRLGYSLGEKNALYSFLKSKNFNDISIRSSGLFTNSMDFFRDRIMIPIQDLTGRVIAFGGRLIESSNEYPKYINSPDTPIFKKGETVFGLYHAKQHIREKGYVIMVEGYIDVILCHQYGFKNTVAPLGTALTLGQLSLIKRLTNKILVIFDGDEAGITAAQRSLIPLFQAGFIVKVALLPENEDPASILQKSGQNALKNYISKAFSPVELFMKLRTKNLSEKVHEVLHAISHLKDLIYREELLKELSEKTKINEITLREQLKQIVSTKKTSSEPPLVKDLSKLQEEEILLQIICTFPDRANDIISKINVDEIENQLIKNIFNKANAMLKNEDFTINRFLNYLNDEEKIFISKLIMTAHFDEESVKQSIDDCIIRLNLKSIDKKIKEAAKAGDEKTLLSLIKTKQEILRKLK